MGAEKGRHHYYHEFKVWGLPGETVGKLIDTARIITNESIVNIKERTEHRSSVENIEEQKLVGSVALTSSVEM